MPFFNFQLERGANLLESMETLRNEVKKLNAPGGLLAQEARDLGMSGTLELVQTYDSTTYVEDAIDLVRSNILVGAVLATLTLLFFLRSLRTVGIIALAIPVSVIASLVVLVALGRSINIISLAGLAFAVGMVVDNAIVVIENIYRHLEFGKKPRQAALDGSKEVAGAVVASTMTTLIVFAPILLIQEIAGQLFRDIALAIMVSVGLSMIVSLTLIPAAAARFLQPPKKGGRSSFNDFLAASSSASSALPSARYPSSSTRLPTIIGAQSDGSSRPPSAASPSSSFSFYHFFGVKDSPSPARLSP